MHCNFPGVCAHFKLPDARKKPAHLTLCGPYHMAGPDFCPFGHKAGHFTHRKLEVDGKVISLKAHTNELTELGLLRSHDAIKSGKPPGTPKMLESGVGVYPALHFG